MPQAIRAITRIQDADDITFAGGAGDDGKNVQWDNGTSKFVMASTTVTTVTVATRDTILATSPASAALAYASDTERFYVWDGAAWFESAIEFVANASLPDMGVEQNSSRQGYGSDYVDSKVLTRVKLGNAANSEAGAIRYSVSDSSFQVYSAGTWNDVVLGFRFREDSDEYELEHRPIGLDFWYEVMSGNSDVIGMDGRPLIQQYSSSMGAYQRDLVIDGGTF